MAFRKRLVPDVNQAIDEAIADMVSSSFWGGYHYVSLPIFMPSGSPATVRISMNAEGFEIDDAGFAFREIEAIGAERSFPKIAAKYAALEHLETDRRRVFVKAPGNDLKRAIADVALASRTIASEIYAKVASEDVSEIEDYLQERLQSIFGSAKVEPGEDVVGASSKKWPASAVVHLPSGLVVFQAVSNHANSINRASTAFHDIAELPNPPARVAVVKDREEMGVNLRVLSQAGRVIQGDQPDEIYKKAAA